MEEVCKVGPKNCERIFGVEELSSVQKCLICKPGVRNCARLF